jgi:hypothetical protein
MDNVYVPPLHRDMLQRVWEEFSYHLDVRAAGGGHIERVTYMSWYY